MNKENLKSSESAGEAHDGRGRIGQKGPRSEFWQHATRISESLSVRDRRFLQSAEEVAYFSTVAFVCFAWGPITGTKMDVHLDPSLAELLNLTRIPTSPFLDRAIAGTGSFMEKANPEQGVQLFRP